MKIKNCFLWKKVEYLQIMSKIVFLDQRNKSVSYPNRILETLKSVNLTRKLKKKKKTIERRAKKKKKSSTNLELQEIVWHLGRTRHFTGPVKAQ